MELNASSAGSGPLQHYSVNCQCAGQAAGGCLPDGRLSMPLWLATSMSISIWAGWTSCHEPSKCSCPPSNPFMLRCDWWHSAGWRMSCQSRGTSRPFPLMNATIQEPVSFVHGSCYCARRRAFFSTYLTVGSRSHSSGSGARHSGRLEATPSAHDDPISKYHTMRANVFIVTRHEAAGGKFVGWHESWTPTSKGRPCARALLLLPFPLLSSAAFLFRLTVDPSRNIKHGDTGRPLRSRILQPF